MKFWIRYTNNRGFSTSDLFEIPITKHEYFWEPNYNRDEKLLHRALMLRFPQIVEIHTLSPLGEAD